MLQFVCDYCGNVKQPAETWIAGAAVENVGTQAARREVIIDSTWRRDRAVQPFAVHFCCVRCKDSYLAELFNQPAELLQVESSTVEPTVGKRVVRAKKKPVANPVQGRTRKYKVTKTR